MDGYGWNWLINCGRRVAEKSSSQARRWPGRMKGGDRRADRDRLPTVSWQPTGCLPRPLPSLDRGGCAQQRYPLKEITTAAGWALNRQRLSSIFTSTTRQKHSPSCILAPMQKWLFSLFMQPSLEGRINRCMPSVCQSVCLSVRTGNENIKNRFSRTTSSKLDRFMSN